MAVNTPSVIYEPGVTNGQANEWRKLYSKFNAGNLETQDVLKVPNTQFVFVHEEHPIINLLRMNKRYTGVDIENAPKMDGQWYKLTGALMQSSCDIIRSNVLSKISTSDLTTLQVQLNRLGGQDWSTVNSTDALMTFAPNPAWDEETLRIHTAAHEKNFTEKPATFMARIQLDYEIQK